MKECLYLQQQQHQQQQQLSPTGSQDIIAALLGNSMPCWYYDKRDLRETPSIFDGISFETERRYRKEGARFIMTCGTQMGLGHNTMATGVVYFHRFYMFHSFKSFPRYVTACCCLFLAGKVEETPKKCRDVIKTARTLLTDNHFYSFGEDPKEEVMTLERILLQTIKFDLQVEHPYSFLLKYAKCIKGDQQKLQKMVQMAWNFVNDSLSTVVCLQWEPEIIAVALIHLASKLSKFTVLDWVGRQSHHMRWWDMFVADVTMEIIEDICHQVLDLYQSNQKDAPMPPSPPQKPPSRADSPTPMRNIVVASNLGSPVAKAKPTINAANSTGNSIASNNSNCELSNIQTIKSLSSTGPVAAPANADNMSNSGIASNYHMYTAQPIVNTHQMHTMYGSTAAAPPPPPPHSGYALAPVAPASNVPNVVAPPLPPAAPMTAFGAPSANNWQPSITTSHYANVPPPLPPGASSGSMSSHPHAHSHSHPHTQPHSTGRIPPQHGSGHGGHGAHGGGYYHQSASYGRQPRY